VTRLPYTDLLATFGATYEPARVVVDGNRVTGGGVTAGLDFALRLVALLEGDDAARAITLRYEYDPAPPFACGHPDRADPALVAAMRARARAGVPG